jgi:hypothetical protein
VSKGDCDCPRQWASCKCDGFSISTSLQKNPDLLETTLTYQMNTLRKGALEVPKYLRQEGSDFSKTFDPDKALELPNLGGVEYTIETDRPVLYGPLYNLSEI